MLRRLCAGLLLAGALAGGTSGHHHAFLAEEDGPAASAPQVVTNHRGQSTAPHIHAILRIVEPDSCWACHWHRLFTVSSEPALPEPIPPGRTLTSPPPRAAATIARFTRLSRGPPTLL